MPEAQKKKKKTTKGVEEVSLVERIQRYDEYLGEVLSGLPQEYIKEQEPEISAYAQKKFYKNASGSTPAQTRKEASKRGKRLKYDLDAREKLESDEKNAQPEEEIKVPKLLMQTEGSNLEELREKYQAKLAQVRGTRGQPDDSKIAERRAKKKGKKSSNDKKHKQEIKPPSAQKKVEKPTSTLQIPDVTVATVRAPKTQLIKARAPGSKTKRLKALVEEAETKKATLADLRAQGKDDEAKRIEWNDALKIATGERRAPTDPAKIKKALKQREKKKVKSKIAWEKRLKDATPEANEEDKSRRAQRRDRKKKNKDRPKSGEDDESSKKRRKRLAPWERPGSTTKDDDNITDA
uniref:Ribosomal RNA-processing protein 14/surfeit locus protein 6 C-terminal domain-containing protein n=1 Tax=Aureoumbra lagunensis TaxID=44058 RepID=A0A7S3NE02_9STRA|mmetsp:Transcript_22812/g.29557  ORF Transcript_22812/g.29557 Transcript_22812/m.29557 type:complete len:350 (-) Transcript_22812:1316-2365(-)|eukprot:CAMPEP_0197315808 /NCGR_PEP_ID=MMETSP0891-20130614/39595_1 /TAXON_ID=44058 ORGANISM="Aureoumbra lagunensis, Strain CCMP1510" /NCGR_SAMPLE_ID=MMETSP0891 /ASSEMBLY_ACC=CAM_ASM_000534 /LENGTH=349 /DNA_ID=CAMNT_0042804955 /DNA_START=11 /DNA_END=1060 /DNA_ORIENTATION=-